MSSPTLGRVLIEGRASARPVRNNEVDGIVLPVDLVAVAVAGNRFSPGAQSMLLGAQSASMRYRRRFVRRPVMRRRFRRRRIVRRRNFRFRRQRPGRGAFRVKLTKVVSLSHAMPTTEIWSTSVRAKDFPEFLNLAPNFESYRFKKMRVRVIPQQSVANNSTSRVGLYCMFPWHQPQPSPDNNFNSFLSVDRCKIYNSVERGHQNYNMNVLQHMSFDDNNKPSERVLWAPRIEIRSDAAYETRHFSGCIAFNGVASAGEDWKTFYDIVTDVWCDFYNQDTIKE